MANSSKRNFFVQNGRALRIPLSDRIVKEKVSSLFEGAYSTKKIISKRVLFNLKDIKLPTKHLNASLLAIPSGMVLAALFFTLVIKNFIPIPVSNKYSIFSSKPLTLVQAKQDVDSRDSRSQKINEVFKDYSCPLEGMGEIFVREADKNDIPWWLVASVAFQESGCGKNTPKSEGVETYNAWGWGVYGGNAHAFDNWARGIEVVSEYFSDKFFSKGVTELCDIMKVYTPPSNGSWCQGVQHFAGIIQTYQTP